MNTNQVTQKQIEATITTWTHLAKHTDWIAPKVGLALLADRDRLEADVQRLTELRDALVDSMGTVGGIPMTDRLAAALEVCGVEAKREECPASESPVVKEGQPTLEAIEAQWSEFREYLDPQQAGEECAILGFFAALIDIAREQRDQLVRLREIEVSEECYGLLSAHGADGTILVCGEFKSGREFKEKFRAARRSSSPQPATGAKGTLDDETEMYYALSRWIERTPDCPSPMEGYIAGWKDRPSSPQPSADVVVVPRDDASDRKNKAWEDYRETQFNAWKAREDALRSSTNHDSEEAPHG